MINKLTPKDFINIQQNVIHFNEVMGNSVTDKSLIQTYQALSIEELTKKNELLDSIQKGDMIGVLDGILDCCFVIGYYATLKGVDLNQEVKWLERICENGTYDYSLEEYTNHILIDIENGYARAAQRWLIMMMIAHQNNFDFIKGFDEVFRSNMSKYISETELLEGSITLLDELVYKVEAEGRYGEVFYDKVKANGKIYYAFRALQDLNNGVTFRGKGKLVKVEGYFTEPVLEKFVLI